MVLGSQDLNWPHGFRMNIPVMIGRKWHVAGGLLLGMTALSASGSGLFSMLSASESLTAVNSKEYNGYVRTALADGSFQPETYSFGEGGSVPPPAIPGFVIFDPTIDDVKFPEIARVIAGPLAEQNYTPSHDAGATRLLIMVYWGRNIGRTAIWELDGYNASLLGFDAANTYDLSFNSDLPGFGRTFRSAVLEETRADMSDALRVDRYFVILRAYDFQEAWRRKKLKLLWDTRFSLSERRHDFRADLPSMAHTASLYFGQDSHGLVRIPPVPEGHVFIGDVRTIDEQSEMGDALASLAGDWQGLIPGSPPVVLHIDKGGNSTFSSPRQREPLAARVSVNAGAVTVSVPGWDVLFRGNVDGDEIRGTLSQYFRGGPIILTKIPVK
jgi:hypothetical protein